MQCNALFDIRAERSGIGAAPGRRTGKPASGCNTMAALPIRSVGRLAAFGRALMEQVIFIICMFFGVAAVALLAFTLLWIALGKLTV